MSLTKLSLGGNYDVIYKLFLPRESLVSDTVKKLFDIPVHGRDVIYPKLSLGWNYDVIYKLFLPGRVW
jgi:hypothetical protein